MLSVHFLICMLEWQAPAHLHGRTTTPILQQGAISSGPTEPTQEHRHDAAFAEKQNSIRGGKRKYLLSKSERFFSIYRATLIVS
jgi:hypothetical protein